MTVYSYYNLGLSLKKQGKINTAFDAFYKAVWDGNMQDKAFYQLACIASGRGDYNDALEYIEKSLVKGMHNLKARTLKLALLRKLGKNTEATEFAKETRNIDALDHSAYYELYKLNGNGLDVMQAVMRGDNHNYIELALSYMSAYLTDDAIEILKLAPNDNEPMVHYYLYALTNDKSELDKAENSDSLYCFPNRLEDIAVLEKAIYNGGNYAAYYLGCLFYDKGRWEESKELWEKCADNITLPTVYRNLSLVYYNKLKDGVLALKAMEKAFGIDKSDARIFFELDQLYKTLNFSLERDWRIYE